MRIMPIRPTFLAAVAASVTIAASGARSETVLSVTPEGGVEGIRAALDEARTLGSDTIRIRLAPGTYAGSAPLKLTGGDSRSRDAPLIIEGEGAVVSGGRTLGPWEVGADGHWRTESDAGRPFEQLWINGIRATRARTPNADADHRYLYQFWPAGPARDPVTGEVEDLTRRGILGIPADIDPLRSLSPKELAALVPVLYHSWDMSFHRPTGIDPERPLLVTSTDSGSPLATNWPPQRYHLENYRAALDAPGEWFRDLDGTLTYMPRPGEDPAASPATVPATEQLLVIKGEPEGDSEGAGLVEHITFRGIAFHYAGFWLPEGGMTRRQAVSDVGAAIMIDHAREISFENCEIAHTGNYGIWFRRGCEHSTLRDSHLHDLGAGGIRVGEATATAPQAPTRHITIDNNIIQQGGRTLPPGVAVWVGGSGDNVITHNDIGDFYYTGVSLGWRWGYDPSDAKDNRVEFNHIHHIGHGMLSDMAGVYTLGPSEGTEIRHNHIHHILSHHYGGWGMYNDEGSTGILWENNLVHDTRDGGYHQHYGRDNIVRNNILAFGESSSVQRTRVEDHNSFTFERNIVLLDRGHLFHLHWNDENVTLRNNLYFDLRSPDQPRLLEHADLAFAEWQALSPGRDAGSLVADPRFADSAARDFAIHPDSPASEIGFVPFDPSLAGVRGDDAWKHKAASLPIDRWKNDPPPPEIPPMEFSLDYEDGYLGFAKVFPGGGNGKIEISDAAAATGDRSLLLRDAPDTAHDWEPFYYFEPGHTSGTSTASFALRVEAATHLVCEWRENAQPDYRVWASIAVRDGKLIPRGGSEIQIPPDTWFTVTLTAPLGPDADGTWGLTVALPGQDPVTQSAIPVADPAWKAIDWFGFALVGRDEASLHLDDLSLSSDPVADAP
ncbi:right-handed parallel beta-helix repeat-containing protein [soil metagenome]